MCVWLWVQMWERVFFTQDEANRRFLLGNELLLENMMSVRLYICDSYIEHDEHTFT